MTIDKITKFKFGAIVSEAESNFRALRVFSGQVGHFADEYDRGALEALVSVCKDLFPSSFAEPVEVTPSDQEEIRRVLADPGSRESFARSVLAFRRKAPVQGSVLRRGALVSLMSHFEDVISQLVHAYYERYPESFPQDRPLTLAQLRSVGSVADAELFLVRGEVESVLRQKLEDQLNYFGKRFHMKLDLLEPFVADLVEVDQRRNLFVHNQGVVNRQYLANVDAALVEKYGLSEGKQIQLGDKYLLSAIDSVEGSAVVLVQLCGRKWSSSELEEADSSVLDSVYQALRDKRYEFVKRVGSAVGSMKLGTDAARRILLVNRAIAFRGAGDLESAETLLSSMDWSATSLRFAVVVSAVKGDIKTFLEIVPRAATVGEIKRAELDDWPAFDHWRGEEWFDSTVKGLDYGV